jgi:hypothetical protein
VQVANQLYNFRRLQTFKQALRSFHTFLKSAPNHFKCPLTKDTLDGNKKQRLTPKLLQYLYNYYP